MRKMLVAMVALTLAGGVAAAREDVAAGGRQVRTHRLHRWGFDARGPSESDVAYRDCSRDRLITVNTRRTAGDMTLALLSLGWYTPAHVTVSCTP